MARLLRILLILIGGLSPLRAHVIEQFYVEARPTHPGWQLVVLFDVGYADPETRGDPDTPQPTREWLLARSDEEHARYRAEAEAFLSDCLGFNGPEEAVEVIYEFPDFETDPPSFPELLTGGAYYRVTITPETPSALPLRMWLAETDTPNFVIAIPDEAGGENGLITLTPGESVTLPGIGEAPPKTRPAITHALIEGYLHVLPLGLDHILFILGLFLLQRSFKPLMWQSLTFTAAHTLTLGLTAAGWITPSPRWIEPLIALSILALAVENLMVKEPGRWRFVIVFLFGLVHGMGFANALAGVVTDGHGFLPRLLAANLGVELAQISVLLSAWVITLGWHGKESYQHARVIANVMLGLTALVWFIQRVA